MSERSNIASVKVTGPKAAYLAGLADYEGLVQKKERRTKGSRLAILKASTEIFARRGFCRLKVGEIYPLTGFSRQTFYSVFKTKEECFEAVLAAAGGRLRAKVSGAIEGVDGVEGLGRAVEALLEFVLEDPDGAKVLVVEGPVAASAGMDRCRDVFPGFWRWLAGELGYGWSEVGGLVGVGGIEALLAARLRGETAAVSADLVPFVTELSMKGLVMEQRDDDEFEGGGGCVV